MEEKLCRLLIQTAIKTVCAVPSKRHAALSAHMISNLLSLKLHSAKKRNQQTACQKV